MDFSEQQIKTLKTVVSQIVKDEGRDTRDYVDQTLAASEHRMIARIDATEQRIIEAVGQMVDNNVLPQVDDHEQRLVVLEAKIA